jgi:hypothetical protein
MANDHVNSRRLVALSPRLDDDASRRVSRLAEHDVPGMAGRDGGAVACRRQDGLTIFARVIARCKGASRRRHDASERRQRRWLRITAESRIDRPFGSIRSNNFEIVVWLLRLLIFDVLLPDFISNIAAGCHPVSARPQMLTPIPLPQRLILRQKLMRTLSLEVLHRTRHRKLWGIESSR